jgi:hypothetical protein
LGGERGRNKKIDNPGQTTLQENVHIPSSRVLKILFWNLEKCTEGRKIKRRNSQKLKSSK